MGSEYDHFQDPVSVAMSEIKIWDRVMNIGGELSRHVRIVGQTPLGGEEPLSQL